MTPAERLAQFLAPMPPDALLPVEWVRAHLTGPTAEDDHGDPLTDLTVEEAAKALGRRPSTVRGWCAAGLLPEAYRLGRAWRIPRASLRRYGKRPSDDEQESRRCTGRVDLGSWRRLRRSQEGEGAG